MFRARLDQIINMTHKLARLAHAINRPALAARFGAIYSNRPRMQPRDHPPLVGRADHLFGHKLGVDLPDVLTIAPGDPAVSLTDALLAEGLGNLDLGAVAVLACPLLAIQASDRAETTRLCRHP